ncbi:MAG TPA: hypothetical protein IAC50_04525 [Candidatus Copromorpha excrementigallinarum]|uniref:Tetratricopeptide repeat protein n=1 Tax=Candidatus Allocopromorpha excrementigallinarum TaxID=2840742 RepID=A0A9D1I0J6_9FIRM|nr:hypothetical protein [Candidatus Copromorpha excrementigallinarum]
MKKLKNWRYQKEFDTRTLMSKDIQEGELLSDSKEKQDASEDRDAEKKGISVRALVGEEADSREDSRDASTEEKEEKNSSPSPKTRKVADLKELSEARSKESDGRETQVYEPRPLTPEDDIYEDILEHFSSAPTKPKYWFEEFGDYWSCSCGHINKGDICTNCGLERDLLRSLFILHKPVGATENPNKKVTELQNGAAFHSEEAGSAEEEKEKKSEKKEQEEKSSQAASEETKKPSAEKREKTALPVKAEEKKKPVSRRKLIIIIAVMVAVLVLLSVCAYGAYIKYAAPAKKYDQAQQLQADGKYAEAIEIYESLGDYEDSRDMIWRCWISIGDEYSLNGQYEDALNAYYTASDLRESQNLTDKINQAKFGYVEAHQSEGGDTFLQYMTELRNISYPGVEEIYDAFYAWHIKIIANTSEDDLETDMATASRSDTIYFHVLLSGGEPSETIELYYEITWPNGSSQTYSLDSQWKSGSTISARFQYPIPLFGREGALKFQLYDRNSNELLGSDSIELRN